MSMQHKKKALIVATVGGFVSQFEMSHIRILQDCGFEVHYASNFDDPVYAVDQKRLMQEGMILHQIPIRKSPRQISANWNAYRQLRNIIRQENIELVHCHTPMGGVLARLAARSAETKKRPYVIYTAHGFHFYRSAPFYYWLFFYPVERFLAHQTDCLVTINQEDFKRAGKFRLRGQGSVVRMPGVGVDTERFCRKPEQYAPMRKRLGIPENAFHIVTAGELNKNKNEQILLRAVEKLHDPTVHYTICGEGPLETSLKKMTHQLGLDDQIHFMGFCPDMERILQSADCFAFPSFREGLGMAAVEALACGVPVIAADNRGTREYMKDGYNGIVCRGGTVEEYADAVRRLRDDEALRRKMSEHAADSIADYTTKESDRIMREVYDKTLAAWGKI